MPSPNALLPLLLAQGNAPAGGGGGDMLSMIVTFLPMLLLFYFIMVLPQQKQEKKRRAMIDALKPNDEVLTSAGIYGTVVRIDPEKERVVLRVGDGVKLTFSRSSVVSVVQASEKEKAAESAASEAARSGSGR